MTLLPATGQSGAGQGSINNSYPYPGGPLSSTTVYDESRVAMRQVSFNYDAMGALIRKTGDTEASTSSYDGLDRLLTLQDGNNHATSYRYDLNGRLTKITYPDGTSTQATSFDADDRVLTRLEGNGNTITYAYNDPTGLLTNVSYPGAWSSLNVQFSYNSDNRRTLMIDGSGSTATTYDTLGNPLTVTTSYTGAPAQTLTYIYNPDGSRASLSAPTLPGNGTFSYNYDGVGNLSGLTNPYGYTAAWTYSANNIVQGLLLGNGVAVNFAHNALGQLSALTNLAPDGVTVLSSFSGLMHDGVGNLVALTANVPQAPALSGQTTFGYDGKDQLTAETSTRNGGYTVTATVLCPPFAHLLRRHLLPTVVRSCRTPVGSFPCAIRQTRFPRRL